MPSTFDLAPFEQYFESRGPYFDSANLALDGSVFVRTLLQRATDLEFLRGYAAACPVAGAEPGHYALQHVTLDTACSVLAAIHFRRLSLDFPFVDVSAQSAPLPRRLPLTRLVAPFLRFRPRAVRIWRAETDSSPSDAEDDLLVLAAPIRLLLATPPLPNLPRIRLEPDPSLASYADYRCVYDALHSVAPETAELVSPEEQSSLAKCADYGAFFRVLVDGALAGFIAARPESYRCWRGWHVVEEVLHPDFRRQGLAPAMQQAFLRTLDSGRETCVFGTIAASNVPSLRTALRVGRRIVEVGTFIHLDRNTTIRDS